MYKKFRHIALFSFFLFYTSVAFGVEGKVKMRRICLNSSDSTATLLWFPPTDNCGSFTEFSVYGREDAVSLFQYMGRYTNFSLSTLQIKLPNIRRWEFYLVYSRACNGTDSLYSDTLIVDKTQPANSFLDSVSIDLVSQQTIIGWRKNPSPDTKGYFIYQLIGTTTHKVIYNILGGSGVMDVDPLRSADKGPFKYEIAAYDSCDNLSIISPNHTTMHLRLDKYDECNKQIDIQWTPYVGWGSDDYEIDIYLKINNGNYQRVAASLVSSFSRFTYNFDNFGDQFCFYIRAKNKINGFTSSSNVICVSSNTQIQASDSYIANVSVQNQQVELTFITQTGTSIAKINVYKAENNGPFSLWQSIATTGGIINLTDNQVKVNSKNYKYYFTTVGASPCNLIFDTSQISETILLKHNMLSPGFHDLNWNLYSEFKKLTANQELLLINNPNSNKSSPWNILNALPNTTTQITDNSLFSANFQQLCYCIRAIENNPSVQYPRKDTSYSNIVCATADPIVYFPNAIQVNGYNTQFYPQGVYLDYAASSFQVYNRWGELLYETKDIQKPWEGKNLEGDYVEEDVYIYKAIIVGINGKVLIFDGTVTVLK